MPSQGYRDWLNAGRPYTLIRPAAALVRKLQPYGLTVYGLGPPNDAHLLASTPEDHTPFSATGWPGQNRRWNARGVDVMPRSSSYAHRKENADIARQLIKDRDAGVPGVMWIKYLNWTDEDGTCRQERWMNAAAPLARTTRSSSDRGHIHISGRSDVDDDDRADGYDPIARMRGEDDDMQLTDKVTIPLFEAVDGVGVPETETLSVSSLLAGAYRRSYIAMHLAEQTRDAVADLAAKVAQPAGGGPPVDLDALADKVAARLGDQLAGKVGDLLAARLAQ